MCGLEDGADEAGAEAVGAFVAFRGHGVQPGEALLASVDGDRNAIGESDAQSSTRSNDGLGGCRQDHHEEDSYEKAAFSGA